MVLYSGSGEILIGEELKLHSKKFRQIRNELGEEKPKYWHELAHSIMVKNHPSLGLRTTTSVYNCLGLVFAARRTWVHETIENIEIILNDDEYRQIQQGEDIFPGDVLFYRHEDGSFAHVAIVLNAHLDVPSAEWISTLVISKWGKHGEYIHGPKDIPYYLGSPSEFYTDRN